MKSFLSLRIHLPSCLILVSILNVYAPATAIELTMLGEPQSTTREEQQSTTAAAMLSISTASIAEDISYSYGDPTIAEQVHLEEINRARINPSAEAVLHGVDLNEGLADGTISSDPVQPLVFNAKILTAARNHSQEMLDYNYFSHYSLSGDSPGDRVTAQGYAWQSVGENLAFRAYSYYVDAIETSIQLHADLYIDEGIDGRGHRVNLFVPYYKEVGIGFKTGSYTSDSYTFQYAFMLTCDFASAWDYDESFILGVVFDDDGNNFYDAGEGKADITIQIFNNDILVTETTTATAGGYGVPISDGTYTVKALESETKYAEKTVTVNGLNQKVDFFVSELVEHKVSGDFDGDLDVDLSDAIAALQALVDSDKSISVHGDTDGDGKIGLPDILSVLNSIAE